MKNSVNLFCIPYAGGNASAYRCFMEHLDSEIVPYFIELAGHGRRMGEKLKSSVMENAEDIYSQISARLDGTPFILFGHSMGTLLEYEVLKLIQERKGMAPIHAFFSGRYTPDVFTCEEHYKLPEDHFLAMLRLYGGTPDEFYSSPELIQIFLPIIRNDYQVVETYNFGKKKVFDADFTVMAGREDCIVSREQMEEWKTYTTGRCDVHMFNGDHFYLFKEPRSVCELINNVAHEWLDRRM